ANEFAEDIERYLNKEPILARPRSAVYLVRKFVQRNRGLVASVFAILLLLITGIIGTTSALVYALKAQRETNTQLWALQLKSTWNDWNIGNTESAWQTLRQIDPESASWTSQYLANEMFTCEPSDILHGHASIVLTTDTSPDGTRILSGGADNVVYLWDANSNSKISRVLMDEMITSVRFSQNGESFLVADRSNTVSLFETQSGKRLHKYGPYEEDVSSVAFHPTRPFLSFGFFGNDSRRVGTVRKREFAENRPAKLVIVDLASGEIRLTLDGHADEITSLEFSQTGELLFSSCLDGGLRIWDCDLESDTEMRCELSRTIDVDPSGIHELALSPDGTTVVCAGQDQTASLYEIETGRLVARLTGHSAGLLGVDFSPRGDLIATCASDQTAIVWNLDGQIQKKLKGHSGPVNEVRFLPNGRQVVTASDDLKLRHWSMDVPGATWTQRDFHDTAQWQADFSPDKRTVATAGEDGLISLIDTRTGAFIKRLRHESGSLCLVWLESGRLITAGEGNELVVWDHPDNERAIQEPTRVVAIDDEIVWDISVSPDQRQIAFGGSDRSATILDAITLEAVGQLTGHQQGLASVRFSADGRYLVTASDDQSVKVWDAKNYELLQTLEGHHQPVWRAVFSPTDSRLIASSSADGSVLLWDWQKASIKTTFDGHASQVAGLAFTPDGKCLLSASDDGTVIVWDIELGMDLFVFEEQPSSAIIHASFSKDGQSLVTTGMGITTLRHARSVFRTPYLRRDATEEMLRWEYRVVADEIDDEEILKIERLAEKASRHNPSYLSLRNFGIAQSRLDKHPQAIETLLEAKRIQRVVYGGGDVRPFTEGFLAVSLLKNDEPERAREMKAEFESLAQEWQGDPRVQSVRARVRRAFSQ
ncbi:MAG: WD40 repeat domain-containing protein, partial [Planctomycetota bacterium]